MNALTILIIIISVGIVLWLVNSYVPMAPPVKTILNVIVVLGLIIWLLTAFGVLGHLGHTRVGKHHGCEVVRL